MTPKEYKQQMRVKVVASKQFDSETYRIFRGGIVEVESINYKEQNVCVKTNEDYGYFNLSDVQIVTPVKFNGVEICVGDKVNGHEVLDYYMYDGEWRLLCGTFESTWSYTESDIESHDPLYKESLVGKEVEVDIDGKIYKAKII